MHAVNLLPPEQRAPVRAPVERSASGGGSLLLIALAVVLMAVVAHTHTANELDRRQGELATAQAALTAAQARASSLAPARSYAAGVAERSAGVRSLAQQRLPWERTFDELARALPSDARVSRVTTTPGPAGEAATAVPTMVVSGCIADQDRVPDLLSRLGDLRGATRAALGTSRRDDGEDATCGRRAPDFEVTVTFGGWSAGA